MRFSKWHAHGNVYLLTDEPGLTPERVRAEVGDADGIVEVVSATDAEADVVDLERGRLDGRAVRQRHPHRRALARRSNGSRRSPHSSGDSRDRRAQSTNSEVEQELGAVTVADPERIAGLDVIVVDVGNPHAVVIGDPDDLPHRAASRDPPALSEPHERPGSPRRRPGEVTARVWERGVGEHSLGNERRRRRRGPHGEGDVLVHFPAGPPRASGDGATLAGLQRARCRDRCRRTAWP